MARVIVTPPFNHFMLDLFYFIYTKCLKKVSTWVVNCKKKLFFISMTSRLPTLNEMMSLTNSNSLLGYGLGVQSLFHGWVKCDWF